MGIMKLSFVFFRMFRGWETSIPDEPRIYHALPVNIAFAVASLAGGGRVASPFF
jgi:hypothetical protein